MNVGKTFYAKNRREWRAWLAKHHATVPEIWLVYYKKHSGKPRIPYNHAAEGALCYGWIDSTVKTIDIASPGNTSSAFPLRTNGFASAGSLLPGTVRRSSSSGCAISSR